MPQKFKTQLLARGPKEAWTYLSIPFEVLKVFGTKARVPVAGTVNGVPFRSSLMPEGDGTHSLTISKVMQQAAKAAAGDTVRVILDRDDAPRIVDVPPRLQAALDHDVKSKALFEALAYSHQKAFVDWIAGAKREETITARVTKTLVMLQAGQRI